MMQQVFFHLRQSVQECNNFCLWNPGSWNTLLWGTQWKLSCRIASFRADDSGFSLLGSGWEAAHDSHEELQAVIHPPVTQHFLLWCYQWIAPRNTACNSRPWPSLRASFAACLATDWFPFSGLFIFILLQFPFLFQHFQTHSRVPSGELIC